MVPKFVGACKVRWCTCAGERCATVDLLGMMWHGISRSNMFISKTKEAKCTWDQSCAPVLFFSCRPWFSSVEVSNAQLKEGCKTTVGVAKAEGPLPSFRLKLFTWLDL